MNDEIKQKIDSDSLKAVYYYIRDANKSPVVTVCLIVENKQIVARGVAICSERDFPNRQIGRGISYGRALKAYTDRRSGGDIFRDDASNRLLRLPDCDFGRTHFFKYSHDPVLTPMEKALKSKFK
jgi:hypothetical protein